MGQLLLRLRLAEGVTQREFAARLGFTAPHLCEIEAGRKLVSPERAASMARTLRLSEQVCVRLALQDLIDQAGLAYRVYVKPAVAVPD